MEQSIYQKQFSISEILSMSWNVFKANLRTIVLITLAVYIPINIILSFVPIGDSWDSLRIYFKTIEFLEGLIGIIATMAITYTVKKSIDGTNIEAGEALKKSVSKWGTALMTSILLGFYLLGLTLLLIVPAIIYGIYWAFVIYVVILHDKSGNDALQYSKSIVKGRWWTVAGYSIVFGLMALIFGIVLAIPFYILPEGILLDFISNTFLDIVFSFFVVISAIFFINFDATKKVDTPNIVETKEVSESK